MALAACFSSSYTSGLLPCARDLGSLPSNSPAPSSAFQHHITPPPAPPAAAQQLPPAPA
eukprot:CAMPEP_0202911000 /NCGR_PEP_ID=MMETSP1392-20130828/53718_1 /ASSEMBLY_ACC=CAM_ASM_000868 /TAXON_ID=225041 /ORGANISM="Chlamydomonas chlamydogama, Strain SAG 11-48b" /LENGTH=58 /DNA_ID=CAMNT_0049601339 /DNA_START=118 /DNA_END=290 /DNA_ORIENTATION=+